MGDSDFRGMEDFSMSIKKLRSHLDHAIKSQSPGDVLIATVEEVEKTIHEIDSLIFSNSEQGDQLRAEAERLRRELADLKEFAYERAPKIAIEEADKQIKPLKEEIAGLRQELGYIANAKRRNFLDAEEFRAWAQNRAMHALGLKPGELTIRKEKA
jgi:chromosome segregation ATPase